MTQFFTQCPHCQTSFKIVDEQLEAAEGFVRCGSCLEIFSALEYKLTLKENISSEEEEQALEPETRLAPEAEAEIKTVKKTASKAQLHQHLSQLTDEDSLEILQVETIEAIDIEPVELSLGPASRSRLATAFLLLFNLLLLITLLSQYAWYNLETLIENPRLTKVSDLLCQYIVCPEKEMLDLSQLYTEELIIRSHPTTPNALQVDFIFSNQADFEQNFPLAEISFSDTNDRLLANRQFTPQEYLPAELAIFARMPAKSSIQISLEIADPGEQAVNYSLDFK